MNRKIIFAVFPIIILACNFLFPPHEPTTQTDSAPELVQTNSFTLVRLHLNDSDLQDMLAAEAQKASDLGQMPVVEFDATWCPPCQAIDAALNAKNDLMLKAYAGTYIIRLDVDEWSWDGDRIQKFDFEFIPVYFKLDAEGNQTGEVIDGGAWGEDIPENIALVMDKFFHGDN